MKEFNVIIIDQDGEMKDMQRYSCLSAAVQDAQEYVRLYPQAQVGVYRWTENVTQYFSVKGEWWIKTGSKWERGEPENLTDGYAQLEVGQSRKALSIAEGIIFAYGVKLYGGWIHSHDVSLEAPIT